MSSANSPSSSSRGSNIQVPQATHNLLNTVIAPKSQTEAHVRNSADVRKTAKSLTNLTLTWAERPKNVLVVKKYRDPEVTALTQQLLLWLIEELNLVVYLEQSALDDDGDPPLPPHCDHMDMVYDNVRVWQPYPDTTTAAAGAAGAAAAPLAADNGACMTFFL